MASPRYSLDKVDFKKIAKGALIAVAGAVTAYILDAGIPTEMDKSAWVAFLTVVSSVAYNALRKFLVESPKEIV